MDEAITYKAGRRVTDCRAEIKRQTFDLRDARNEKMSLEFHVLSKINKWQPFKSKRATF
jgi:hypothetical protein